MVAALDSALSALNASSKRIEVAAKNIANQNSTKSSVDGQQVDKPYTPQKVDQVSLTNGGVIAKVNDIANPTQTQPDSEGNPQQVPNIDQAQQLIDMKVASYDFKANLKTIKVQQEIFQSLLDIKA